LNVLCLIDKITKDALPLNKIEPILSLDKDSIDKALKDILYKYKKELSQDYINKNKSLQDIMNILKDL
jgi:hypothetical protein